MVANKNSCVVHEKEEFRAEAVVGNGNGEQRLILHRKNSRLHFMHIPSDTHEMVYVENFFETHWLKKARFWRKNVEWPAVEYVRAGSLIVESPDLPAPLTVRPGCLVWLPSGNETLLRTGAEGFCQKVSLTMGGLLLNAWQNKSGFYKRYVLLQADTKRFELLLDEFCQLSGQQINESLRHNGLLTWKLLQFLQDPAPIQEVPEGFLNLLEMLKKNYAKPITLEMMSCKVQCSQTHLVRSFRKYFGETPHKMLRNLRMHHAADQLLTRTDLSIKEISDQVGYSDALTFSAEFKKHFGESPRQYRRRRDWN
jgi:AraC-like DNA-binding protein